MRREWLLAAAAFAIATFVGGPGCAEFDRPPQRNIFTNASFTRTRGQREKHFSSRFEISSNFVESPEYQVVGELPPGLAFNESTGMLEGTPTQSGFWTVKINYRDRAKGVYPEGFEGNLWYYVNTEFKIFDELTDER